MNFDLIQRYYHILSISASSSSLTLKFKRKKSLYLYYKLFLSYYYIIQRAIEKEKQEYPFRLFSKELSVEDCLSIR